MLNITTARCAGLVLALASIGALFQAEAGTGTKSASGEAQTYKQECSACHIAYPAGMLPPASWKRLMGDLSHHFGQDASLDAKTVATLSEWLVRNGGTLRHDPSPPPQDRITLSKWFLRQHGEVRAATWKRASIKGPSNCIACHAAADTGNFSERNVHIPR